MKRLLFIMFLCSIFLVSCENQGVKLFTRIVHHSSPLLEMDNSYFSNLGCFNSTECLPQELQALDPQIDTIYEPSVMLGGLSPEYPIAAAWSRGLSDELPPYIYGEGCMMPFIVRYLIAVDDHVQLVDSTEAMAALYAPIESPEEALSFAVAETGFSALYDLNKTPLIRFYVNKLHETYVKTKNNGYLVHLFDTNMCGCGPHIIDSVDVAVSKEGKITIGEHTPAFRDITNDGLCID